MNKVKNRVLEQLAVKFENQDKFSIPDVLSVAEDMGWTRSNAYTFLNAYPKLGKKGRYGVYNLEAALIPFRSTVQNIGVTSISNGEVFIPEADPTFVAWGNFADVS